MAPAHVAAVGLPASAIDLSTGFPVLTSIASATKRTAADQRTATSLGLSSWALSRPVTWCSWLTANCFPGRLRRESNPFYSRCVLDALPLSYRCVAAHRHNPCPERAGQPPIKAGLARRWSSDANQSLLSKDAGGSRTHFELLCRQPPRRLAPASK